MPEPGRKGHDRIIRHFCEKLSLSSPPAWLEGRARWRLLAWTCRLARGPTRGIRPALRRETRLRIMAIRSWVYCACEALAAQDRAMLDNLMKVVCCVRDNVWRSKSQGRYDEGMTHLVRGLCVAGVLARRTEMDHVICPLLRSSACSTHCDIKRDVTQLLSELRALEIVQAGRHTFYCIVVLVLVYAKHIRLVRGYSAFLPRCDRLHQIHLI